MKIVGFNFNKIYVEKKSNDFKGTKISNSIDIIKIDSVKNDILVQKEDLLSVNFKFTVDFGEEIAKIELEGSVLIALDPKEAKKTIKDWKEKELTEEFKIPLFNIILRKSNIKALELGDDMNLPPHVQLPSLKKN